MLKKIFESTLIMGASSLVVMALEMIRVKILAVMLGPEGIGMLSVLNQYHILAYTIISLGLGTGIVKYVSTFGSEGDHNAARKVAANAFQLVFFFSIAVFVATIVMGSNLSKWLIQDQEKSHYLIIYAISFPLAVYPFIAGSFLQGLKRINVLAKIKIFKSLLSLLFIAPLVYFYKLDGAILSVLVLTIVHFALCFHYLRKENNHRKLFHWHKFDSGILEKLLPYGFASLLTGATYYLSHLLLKLTIIHSLGIEMNGIYQPVWALTMTYPAIVLSSMSSYSYPRLCELHSNKEIVEELNGVIRVSLLLIVPVMFFILIARKPIIQVLYSDSFLPCIDYMPIQILGDFFKVLVWTTGAFLLPTKRLKAFIWLGVLPDSLLVVFALILVKQYQLHGIAAAFTICFITTFVVYYLYAKREIQFYFWGRNRRLIAFSVLSIVILIAAMKYFSLISSALLIFGTISGWGLLSIKKEELLQLKQYLAEKWSKTMTVSAS
jgi:PST family polysaccharide transporter